MTRVETEHCAFKLAASFLIYGEPELPLFSGYAKPSVEVLLIFSVKPRKFEINVTTPL